MKQERQFAIREIISTQAVSNQEDLRRELRRRGFRMTQATLSRDLKDLGVSRAVSALGARYVLRSEAEIQILRPLVGAEVLSIKANEALIVVRTLPGCASVVGEFVDAQSYNEILGTIAGDNTLLVIPSSRKVTAKLLSDLRHKLIEGKQ
jgi:transcriptional regulator of arginine metabolism